MTFLRSLAFNVFFYVHTFVWVFVLLPAAYRSKAAVMDGVKRWAKTNRQALERIGGVEVEFRGLENIP